MIRSLFPLALLAALAGVPALAVTGVATGETALGPVLTDAAGMTLYTFDKDMGGASACYDDCAVNWPPLLAPADAAAEGDYVPSARKDGTMQWTYKGKPLYTWAKDSKPGETTGEGVKGVWHVAKP
jgi:predicted lipoprotein with Yx(FWY)xxD motif